MKTFRLFALVLIPALMVMVSSCTKDDATAVPQQAPIEKVATDILNTPADLNFLEEPLLSEPTPELAMTILNDGLPEIMKENFSEEFQCMGRKKFRIGHLFDTLDLTSEQKAKMIWAMKQHHKCVYTLQKKLRYLNHEIIAKSNLHRDALLKKYKNGDITLKQLKAALAKLRLETQKILKNHPVRKKIIEAMIKCHKEYMENVRLILTKDQWKLWIKFHKQFYHKKANKGDK